MKAASHSLTKRVEPVFMRLTVVKIRFVRLGINKLRHRLFLILIDFYSAGSLQRYDCLLALRAPPSYPNSRW